MSRLKFLILLGLGGGLSAVILPYLFIWEEAKPPILEDRWWGGILSEAEKHPADDPTIKIFVLNVKEAVLQDLQARLNATRLSEPLPDAKFLYGFNTEYLREIVSYWSHEYLPSWRNKHERWLNSFPQYVTQIEGLNLHFLHAKPQVDEKMKVLPLLMIHGWPGSFVEFYKIIPFLTAPSPQRDFVFEVICPSIPGHPFSDAPKVSGFSVLDAARIFSKLMDRLGHKRYFVQGLDWGSAISSILAMAYPERVEGMHVNIALPKLSFKSFLKQMASYYFPSLMGLSNQEQDRMGSLLNNTLFLLQETGYLHLQATKPDTIGVALGDSPAGLAAYMLEKFSTGANPAGRMDNRGLLPENFSLDHLLANVMVYWVSNSITSAFRFQRESFANAECSSILGSVPVKVPSAVAAFPHEINVAPRPVAEELLKDLVLYTNMERGGHFPAMEEPELLAREIFSFAQIVRRRQAR